MNYLFECSTEHLTSERNGWHKVEKDKIRTGEEIFHIYKQHDLLFCLLYRHADCDVFLRFSKNVWPLSRDFQRFSKNLFKDCQSFQERSEDFSIIHQWIEDQFRSQTWYQWNHWYLRLWGYGKYLTRVPYALCMNFTSGEFFRHSCLYPSHPRQTNPSG